MQDEDKNRDQLIDELNEMRRKVAELETTQATAMDTQETMRVNEERFRGMFEKHSAVMLLIEPVTGRIMDANKAAVLFYGYTVSHLCSMSIQDINALSLDDADAQRKLAIEQHRSHLMFPHRLANGEVRTVEVHSSPIEQNGAILLFSIIHDITERKQADQRILDITTYAENIVNTVREPLVVLDWDIRVVSANQSFYRMFGVTPEESTGNLLYDLGNRQWDIPRLHELLEEVLPEKTVVTDFEVDHVFPAIGQKFMSLNARQVVSEEGEERRKLILLAIEDITERKRLEEERLEIQHKLLRAQKLESLAVMAGGIAHDFNNQLASVLGNLELALMDQTLDPKARRKIENAITAAKRSAELSHQMQTYSGNTLRVLVDLDLNKLAHKKEDLLKSSVSKTTTLHFEICKGLAFIRGDVDQIQLIITNLIMNASEGIGDKDGDVTLTTGVMDCDEAYLGSSRLEEKPKPGRFVFLEVTDTGCGMDAETQRRLFDPFFSTKFWGRGLGMAEVIGIIKGHLGAIIVDSEVGKGTTIRVLFPSSVQYRAPSLQDMDVSAVKDSRSDSGAGRKTILVVDDEELVRELCVEWLELLGYDTIAAADGEEGVRIFRERLNEIDMVLLDFVMPRMSGIEAFEELIRIKPDVKVIFSSGYTEDVIRQRFPGPLPASILHKPYDMDILKAELERLLGTAD
jgi:PAS domain S-box-containing protein